MLGHFKTISVASKLGCLLLLFLSVGSVVCVSGVCAQQSNPVDDVIESGWGAFRLLVVIPFVVVAGLIFWVFSQVRGRGGR